MKLYRRVAKYAKAEPPALAVEFDKDRRHKHHPQVGAGLVLDPLTVAADAKVVVSSVLEAKVYGRR